MKEIKEERELAENTVVEHLWKIKKVYPDFDFSYLKPAKKTVELVAGAVKEIKKRKNKEDFMMNGDVKLKPIFVYLKEKVSYEDIKLSLIFEK